MVGTREVTGIVDPDHDGNEGAAPLGRWNHTWLLPAALGLLACGFVMRNGVLLDPDSGGYVERAGLIARSPLEIMRPTLAGQPVNTGMHPPMYPAVLAVFSFLGGELAGARLLNLVVLSATLAVVAAGLRRHCSPAVVLVVVWALVVSRAFLVRVHGFVMSDGLYLALALGAIVALDRASTAASDGPRRRWLAGVVLLTAAATLTRLVGVALVAAIVLSLLRPDGDGVRRPKLAATLGLAGLAPLAVLLALQGWTSQDLDRIGGAAIGWSETVESGREVVRFLAPEIVLRSPVGSLLAVGVVILTVLSLFVVPVAWWALRTQRLPPPRSLALTLVLFAWSQLLVVIASRLLVDRFIWIDARHLTPSWVALLMATALWWASRPATSWWRAPTVERVVTATTITVLLVASITAFRTVTWPEGPWGNLRTDWGSSPIVAATRSTEGEAVVYTNRPDITLLLAERTSRALPLAVSPSTGRPNPDYAAEMAALCAEVQARRAIVVLVDDLDPGWSMPEERAERRLGATAALRVDGGVVMVRGRRTAC